MVLDIESYFRNPEKLIHTVKTAYAREKAIIVKAKECMYHEQALELQTLMHRLWKTDRGEYHAVATVLKLILCYQEVVDADKTKDKAKEMAETEKNAGSKN